MDTAVALVQTYLYANGFFTVTEYPILEQLDTANPRTLTDVDVLAVRFPGAGSISVGQNSGGVEVEPDALLGLSDQDIEVVIGEVKEGAAELNKSARDPHVLRAAIGRVGQIDPSIADTLVDDLIAKGSAMHPGGVRLRQIVFASKPPNRPDPAYVWISHGHITKWLREQVRANWDAYKSIQSKDPALGFMLLHEKGLRGES